MTTDLARFTEALTAVYREQPCRVLPNALWKTLQWLRSGDFTLSLAETPAGPTHLTAYSGNMLAVHWTQDRTGQVPVHLLTSVPLAVVHDDHTTEEVRQAVATSQPYFRLQHDPALRPGGGLPAGYAFALVHPNTEAQAAADLIAACYDTLRPSPETIRGWCRHPVYTPDLWIWVIDTARDRPAGLGIAEFDAGVGEGSLEWIQILPAYRGLRLGQALVAELLRRLSSRAAFTTVSGEAGGPGSPEAFYRRCGFIGTDRWWVLRR